MTPGAKRGPDGAGPRSVQDADQSIQQPQFTPRRALVFGVWLGLGVFIVLHVILELIGGQR